MARTWYTVWLEYNKVLRTERFKEAKRLANKLNNSNLMMSVYMTKEITEEIAKSDWTE